jgi:hypothetical protein
MNGSVPYMDPGVDQVDVAMRPRNGNVVGQMFQGGLARSR